MIPSDASGPLIDCHAHVWGPDMPFAVTAWNRPAYTYSVEHYQADLEAAGIKYGVIAAASLFGTYNDYVIRALRANPNLRATAILDPAQCDFHTIEALRREGIIGARLMWYAKDDLSEMAGDPFRLMCRRLRDFGMHVHVTIEGERLVPLIRELRTTGVPVVIDHFGIHEEEPGLEAATYVDMVRLLDQDDGVFVKISGGFRHRNRGLGALYAQDLLTRFGPSRLFWGSDSPFVGHEHEANMDLALQLYREAVPDPATRRAMEEAAFGFYFADGSG